MTNPGALAALIAGLALTLGSGLAAAQAPATTPVPAQRTGSATVPATGAPVPTVATTATSTPALAPSQGNVRAGATKAYSCLGCHGIPNYNNAYPTYRVPRLGGQHPEYIATSLKAYKSGERKHPTMNAQAMGLSDTDIADLAAWFASQRPGDTKTK